MNSLALSAVLLVTLSFVSADQWALLAAGSSGWYNYRHQADVCHAYQILHKHGIPDDHIVVMMFDDIANNRENPSPGVVINRPDGPNNYKNVLKDYTKETVTAKHFLSILSGDKAAMNGIGSGKVLNTNENDNIFVYFADHGAPGLLAFPHDELTVHQLNKTLVKMYKEKKYAKMVIYVEACESGSMFKHVLDKQPNDLNIYAVTASNSTTSSYACYKNDTLRTYLADQFSAAWLQDSDRYDLRKETLQSQFNRSKAETPNSTVKRFGKVAEFGKLHVSEFQGGKNVTPMQYKKVPCHLPILQEEVEIELLKNSIKRYENQPRKQAVFKAELDLVYAKRQYFDGFVNDFLESSLGLAKNEVNEMLKKGFEFQNEAHTKCHHEVLQTFRNSCFVIGQNSYAAKFSTVLGKLCLKFNFAYNGISSALEKYCHSQKPLPENIV